jgi:hypothetical protein
MDSATCTRPRHDIKVKLVGQNGNAMNLMALVAAALRRGLRGKMTNSEIADEIGLFMNEAMAGDYDHLLRVCMNWVEVE